MYGSMQDSHKQSHSSHSLTSWSYQASYKLNALISCVVFLTLHDTLVRWFPYAIKNI